MEAPALRFVRSSKSLTADTLPGLSVAYRQLKTTATRSLIDGTFRAAARNAIAHTGGPAPADDNESVKRNESEKHTPAIAPTDGAVDRNDDTARENPTHIAPQKLKAPPAADSIAQRAHARRLTHLANRNPDHARTSPLTHAEVKPSSSNSLDAVPSLLVSGSKPARGAQRRERDADPT